MAGYNFGGSTLPYDELMRQRMLAQHTAGIGDELPGNGSFFPSRPRGGLLGPSTQPALPADYGFDGTSAINQALADNAARGRAREVIVQDEPKEGFDWTAAALGFFSSDAARLYNDRKDAKAQHLRTKAIRSQAYDYLVNERNVDPRQALAMVQNMDKLSEEWSTSERTRELAPDHTLRTPGRPDWTAPKTIEDGPNRVQVDPNTGFNRTLYRGKTDAEWAAEAAGYQPQTDDWHRFIRDYHLDGQGPTAVQMHQEDNALSRENNIRTTSTSAANNVRTTSTSAANSSRPRPPAQPNSEGGIYAEIMRRWTSGGQVNAREREFVRAYEARREKSGVGRKPSSRSSGGRVATAVGPGGRRIVVRNGKWVDAQTGKPVQ